MKWLLAGIAFALLVALAVGTAAIRAANVQARIRIQAAVERLEALRVDGAYERMRWRAMTEPARLDALWGELARRAAN